MRFLSSGHCILFTFFITFAFVFAFMLHSFENVKHIYYVRDPSLRKAQRRQLSCEEELKRFWNTPIAKFKFGKSNQSCIHSNPSKGSAEPGFEDLFVPENFKHLSECKPVNVDYYRTPHPKVALASFPGSGNTWTRHLIEQMSGIYTGSVLCGMIRSTFKAECAHKKHNYTIVVKVHKASASDMNKFDRAVLILRNPYDTLFAEFNREKAGKTDTIMASMVNSTGWNRWVLKVAPKWRDRTVAWLRDFKGPVHILSYERMKNNFFQEMYNLASFLKVRVTYAELWCLKKNGEGLYHRKKKIEPVYSVKLRKIIDKFILEVKGIVKDKYNLQLPF